MRRRLALLLAFGAACAVLVASASPIGGDALAHPSDCHAQQTCPSEDHSYIWHDSSGQGWDCAIADGPGGPDDVGATRIQYDGYTYACYPAAPPPTTTGQTVTTPTDTTGTETTPTPPPAPQPKPPAKKPAGATRGSAPLPPSVPLTPRAPIQIFPGRVDPRLTSGGYVFPVYGQSSFTDTYGAARASTSWHHGVDIFAPLGAPILAVADGTVFSVGWNNVGGNRLWLRDGQGNQFYYAHLSAFTPLARNGAKVAAGAVVGFVGATGDAAGTPYHLHFEIHPVSRLHLGYDGSINPTPIVAAWQRLEDVLLSRADAKFAAAAGWAVPIGGETTAPRPGALLLQGSDISTASGLERGSLRRAFAASRSMRQDAWPLEQDRKTRVSKGAERRKTSPPSLREEVGGSPETWMQDVLSIDSPLVWDLVAQCEAGGNWSTNTGNGYSGGLQFHPNTWARYGGYAYADSAYEATREQQITVAERVLASEGWEAWPACSAKLGLR
ncbi:MAG: transglycosylase family protein [Actinobacteria bacterium]|nr:transglycosylase family protein [Actinomycetota bacterium]